MDMSEVKKKLFYSIKTLNYKDIDVLIVFFFQMHKNGNNNTNIGIRGITT